MTLRIAVLGLGRMGSIFATRLVAAGHPVTVWNRTRARTAGLEASGIAVAASPQAAAAGADVVVAILRDDEASRDAWLRAGDGAVHGLAPGALAIEMSTLQPQWATALGDEIAARGAAFLEAPVVGSTPQARAGQLIHFIGGDHASVERARPVLAAWAGAIHHLGPIGSAAVAKLAVNALFVVQVIGVAQYLALLRRAGVDEGRAAALLAELPVASPAARGAASLMTTRRDEALFPIELVVKDLRYASALALPDAAGASLAAATSLFGAAVESGLGGENITAIRKMFA